MCTCNDLDGPSAYREQVRLARKVHRCSECWSTIQTRESYRYVSGIWDRAPASFKICARCDLLRRAHAAAETDVSGEIGCTAPLGELMQTIAECVQYDGRDYAVALQRARRRLLERGPPYLASRGQEGTAA